MVMHLARVDFRNDNRVFGIKPEDRFSHLYIIGTTGTGKSTLLEAMAIQDIECGNGFALIDPHGDLVERIAKRAATSGRAHVIYLNAANPSQPYGYNPLRHVSTDRIALAASGMIEVFKKMWPDALGRSHGAHSAQRPYGSLGTAGRDAARRAPHAFRSGLP
jgi:ABC-type cobalamin transport system ATPase subunit